MTTASDFFDMNSAPMRIGAVRLRVRDLAAVSAFYRSVLGLAAVEAEECRIALGTGATALLELIGDTSLAPRDARQAGLFHTAFLVPSRADLGRWLAHAAATGVMLQGASDHMVSEAIYLADPEGNGIEVYADRPVSRWRGEKGDIRMSTDPLDLQDLLREAGSTQWTGFPEGGRVGHVHLQVGDGDAADRFYRDLLGLELTARYTGASFYGSGGYHHQLACNVWNSRGAGTRRRGMAGLDRVEIVVRESTDLAAAAERAAGADIAVADTARGIALDDPWGTRIAMRT